MLFLDFLESGLYAPKVWIICLALFILGWSLFSVDFQLGSMLNFLIFSIVFIVVYNYGGTYQIPLIFTFLYLMLMVISFLFNANTNRGFF